MASATRYVCNHCAWSVVAWSDGNPFFLDAGGRKQYAHYPDHENLARCIGNDVPHLCLGCGEEFQMDSRVPPTPCPRCGSGNAAETCDLEGKGCPFCHAGTFFGDPDYFAIS